MSGYELDENQGVLNGSSPSAEFDPHSTDMHTAREYVPLDPRLTEDPPAPIQNSNKKRMSFNYSTEMAAKEKRSEYY